MSRVLISRLTLVFSVFILALLIIVFSHVPHYADESIYSRAGYLYVVRGLCPLNYNGEHPPLAKYLFGAAFYLNINAKIISVSAALIVLSVLVALWGRDKGYFASLLLSLDMIFVNLSRHTMLEPVGSLFALLAFLAGLKVIRNDGRVWLLLFALFSSLSLYSKYLFLYAILPMLLVVSWYEYKGRGIGRGLGVLGLFFLVLAGLFPLMYASCLPRYGLAGSLARLWGTRRLYENMHEPNPVISSIGFIHEFFRVEIWRFYNTTFYYNVSNGSLSMGNATRLGWLVQFDNGEFSPHNLLWLPVLLYAGWLVFTGRRRDVEFVYLYVTMLGSMLVFIHEPLAWYYYPATIFFSMMLSELCFSSGRPRNLCLLLLVLDALYLALYPFVFHSPSLSFHIG